MVEFVSPELTDVKAQEIKERKPGFFAIYFPELLEESLMMLHLPGEFTVHSELQWVARLINNQREILGFSVKVRKTRQTAADFSLYLSPK